MPRRNVTVNICLRRMTLTLTVRATGPDGPIPVKKYGVEPTTRNLSDMSHERNAALSLFVGTEELTHGMRTRAPFQNSCMATADRDRSMGPRHLELIWLRVALSVCHVVWVL